MKHTANHTQDVEPRIARLLAEMTLDEKIGQLCLVNCSDRCATGPFRDRLIEGRIGGILNQVNIETVTELQRLAVSESRLGIPLLVGRDVIHGFKTIFPIPLGQAATWSPELVEQAARISAIEAVGAGINWTFAPMLDIARDPRWGRVAESFGEDPYLTSQLGAAAVRGLQGDDLSHPLSIAACAKHFAGYGASESGRDYNVTNIPPNELRNVHLPPFKAAVDAGVSTIMTSFSDLDGIPASANEFLLRRILREEWKFDGIVVSDWDSVAQLQVHGLTANDRESACRAANAGMDMEMSSTTFERHLRSLVEDGLVSRERIDAMVGNILRIKFRLGLFDASDLKKRKSLSAAQPNALAVAREAALRSIVLLTNENQTLPLSRSRLRSIGVVGQLADDGYEQLGTWIFDGDPSISRTPLEALRSFVGDAVDVRYVAGMDSTRSTSTDQFAEAVALARSSDVILFFAGEESILSGEAHCRADISLPGNQEQLIEELAATGTPIVLVIMTGRPLALERVVDKVQAMLCAWHPGSMAGPAIVDLLFGTKAPSGKLPVTFPRVTGQIPIYYSHKNTGRPPTRQSVVRIEDIPKGAPQQSCGDTSFHLDTDYTPLFCFGHGLSYTTFMYDNITISRSSIAMGDRFTLGARLTNAGAVEATEIVQLYIRDCVGSITRPVKELKGFQRITLKPGESRDVRFDISTDDLSFYGPDQELITEPGAFEAWIGGSSDARLEIAFEVVAPA